MEAAPQYLTLHVLERAAPSCEEHPQRGEEEHAYSFASCSSFCYACNECCHVLEHTLRGRVLIFGPVTFPLFPTGKSKFTPPQLDTQNVVLLHVLFLLLHRA